MKKINRRTFLGNGVAAAAVMTAGKPFDAKGNDGPVPLKKNNEDPFNPVTFSAMPTNSFGRTGYKVGILSMGGQATLEIKGREEESEKIINR
ncbi:MAG: hypothetical protein RBT38_13145, partial [Bacteroidales bacterium]|nr:hypothetical protein [Bacteroidales bacterium]